MIGIGPATTVPPASGEQPAADLLFLGGADLSGGCQRGTLRGGTFPAALGTGQVTASSRTMMALDTGVFDFSATDPSGTSGLASG